MHRTVEMFLIILVTLSLGIGSAFYIGASIKGVISERMAEINQALEILN